jgi:leucyl/phenylalanyl-tRNA---protein transferase
VSLHLPRLPTDPQAPFPHPSSALRRPEGLLAFGGDLSPQRLLNAYSHGVFPWFSPGQPILWWCPDPRMVFRSGAVRLSTRFRRQLRRSRWTLHADTAFDEVVGACATAPRPGQDGTWITEDMRAAYLEMHRRGHAHSVEVRDDGDLVGGIYGMAIGRMFFGESMFSAAPGGSKAALAALSVRLHGWGWPLIDAQVENAHLLRMGAERWPRERFLAELERLVALPPGPQARDWRQAFEGMRASDLGSSG